MQVAGEKAGLEPELAVVDLGERIVPVGEFRQDGERAEGFLAIGLGAAVDIFEQRRFEHGPLALAADEQRRTVRARLLNPALEPRGLLLGSNRTPQTLALL